MPSPSASTTAQPVTRSPLPLREVSPKTEPQSSGAYSPRRSPLQSALVARQFVGDMIVCFLGLSTALWLRFFMPLHWLGLMPAKTQRVFGDYLGLLYLGTVLLLTTFFYLNLYDTRLLLRPHRAFSIIVKGVFFWVCVFLGTSLALKFEPAVSRLFVLFSAVTTLTLLTAWRMLFFLIVSRTSYHAQIVQRIAIVGWSEEAAKLVDVIARDSNHPYEVIGSITTGTDWDEYYKRPASMPLLGSVQELEQILQDHPIQIVVVADLHLTRDEFVGVASSCERLYTDFKVIPSFFQIFVSNLRLQTISGVSILGVEALPLDNLANRIFKRGVDVVGALVGLTLSAPIIAVLALLIKRESPGPVFFKQERVGYRGRPFGMFKLRSMRPDAHLRDNDNQSTLREDPRVTRIGAFMRRTNLDELPQFWNVLKGEMSLVGPRPERSYHAEQLSTEIPHYNPRHAVRPGVSGWAQVNGLRGDTDLSERIRYDLYYIENWSLWLDLQILLLTFVRRKNAY